MVTLGGKSHILNDAQILWDYAQLHQELKKPVDVIIGMGSHDTRVAVRVAELYAQKYAPLVVFTGGRGRLTGSWQKTEAEIFAIEAIKNGIPENALLLEKESSNTGENVEFTQKLLADHGFSIESALFVHKPYMERRTYAAVVKQWAGELDFSVTSPQIDFDDYPTEQFTRDDLINIIVGDFQRISKYEKLGFQIHQDIPSEVVQAYQRLVDAGYTKHLI